MSGYIAVDDCNDCRERPLVWSGWCLRTVCGREKMRVGRVLWPHLLSHERQTPGEILPPTPPSVDEESSGYDRRFERKLTPVCSTPAPLSLVKGNTSCKPQPECSISASMSPRARSWWPVLKAASRCARSLISAQRCSPFSRVCPRAAAS